MYVLIYFVLTYLYNTYIYHILHIINIITKICKFSAILYGYFFTCNKLNRLSSHNSIIKHKFGGVIHAPRKVTILECFTLLIINNSSIYSCFSSELTLASNNVFNATC